MKHDIKIDAKSVITQMDGVAALQIVLDVNHIEASSDDEYEGIKEKMKNMLLNAFERFWEDTLHTEDQINYKEHLILDEG
jgi:hypothetical protein